MIMSIHPAHCELLHLADLLAALPPVHGETLRAWCDRTATALEGDMGELRRLFRRACLVNGLHLDERDHLLDCAFLAN